MAVGCRESTVTRFTLIASISASAVFAIRFRTFSSAGSTCLCGDRGSGGSLLRVSANKTLVRAVTVAVQAVFMAFLASATRQIPTPFAYEASFGPRVDQAVIYVFIAIGINGLANISNGVEISETIFELARIADTIRTIFAARVGFIDGLRGRVCVCRRFCVSHEKCD